MVGKPTMHERIRQRMVCFFLGVGGRVWDDLSVSKHLKSILEFMLQIEMVDIYKTTTTPL